MWFVRLSKDQIKRINGLVDEVHERQNREYYKRKTLRPYRYRNDVIYEALELGLKALLKSK